MMKVIQRGILTDISTENKKFKFAILNYSLPVTP